MPSATKTLFEKRVLDSQKLKKWFIRYRGNSPNNPYLTVGPYPLVWGSGGLLSPIAFPSVAICFADAGDRVAVDEESGFPPHNSHLTVGPYPLVWENAGLPL